MGNKKFPNDAIFFTTGACSIESIMRCRILKFVMKIRDPSNHHNTELFLPALKDIMSSSSNRFTNYVNDIFQELLINRNNFFDPHFQMHSYSFYSKILVDNFFSSLRANMALNSKLGFLNCFFQGPGPLCFLTKTWNLSKRRNVTNFVGGCNHLRVETGRWYAVPRPQRVCLFCPVACVEDETHAILYCNSFSTLRAALMEEVKRCFPRLRVPTADQYHME